MERKGIESRSWHNVVKDVSAPGPSLAAALAGLVLTLSSLSMSGCSRGTVSDRQASPEATARTIEQVLREHTEEWMAVPGVVGTGIGECDGVPCIKVFLGQETQESKEAIADSVGGYRVEVEVTGPFKALDPNGK